MNQIGKFIVKADVIAHGLEKYLAFTVSENLAFVDSKQFVNSSLEKLVKNLSNSDFKHLTQEFGSENLKLIKQKDAYPYEYVDSFEKFSEKNYLIKKIFIGL